MTGATIQVFHYGVSLTWSGMMLSLLMFYFHIQDRCLNTDYLTGVYNRRQLNNYLKVKIRNSAKNKPFAAILIDLNDFKQINDTFGHKVGDEALRNAAKILRSSLRQDDFIARLGGDEFFVVMDIENRPLLQQAVARIKNEVEIFNKKGQQPYQLDFAIGYDLYDVNLKQKSEEFFKHIDHLMYEDKKSRQTRGCASPG